MAVSSDRRKLSYEDLVRIPGDGQRHEILDGVHYVTASPVPRHQRVLPRLTLRLGNYVELRQSGEVFGSALDTILSKHDVVVPVDRGLKRASYERLGIFEYWILDADRDLATVYRRAHREDASFQPPHMLSAAADDRLISPLFPGLEISLRDIFSR